MVMYKNGIPLLPAEEIGYNLGLIVSPEKSHLFYNVRAAETSPPAGYGTRIYDPQFEPNVAFKKLEIPLNLNVEPVSKIESPEDLLAKLSEVEQKNEDVLVCFNHGSLVDDPSKNWGHVCVFDRVIDGRIRIVDPSPEHPKWRLIKADKLFTAMQKHGVKKSAGIWYLIKIAWLVKHFFLFQ